MKGIEEAKKMTKQERIDWLMAKLGTFKSDKDRIEYLTGHLLSLIDYAAISDNVEENLYQRIENLRNSRPENEGVDEN